MAETPKKSTSPNTEESPRQAAPATAAAPREEGKKRTTLLVAALFGAMLMNAVLLGIVSVKPKVVIERGGGASAMKFPDAIPEIPDPEKHIDILLGMADTYRRLGKLDKAMELYSTISRAYENSDHVQAARHKAFIEAEQMFEEHKFREARGLYYSFLSASDDLPAEDHRFIEQAHFKIAECFLREAVAERKKEQ